MPSSRNIKKIADTEGNGVPGSDGVCRALTTMWLRDLYKLGLDASIGEIKRARDTNFEMPQLLHNEYTQQNNSYQDRINQYVDTATLAEGSARNLNMGLQYELSRLIPRQDMINCIRRTIQKELSIIQNCESEAVAFGRFLTSPQKEMELTQKILGMLNAPSSIELLGNSLYTLDSSKEGYFLILYEGHAVAAYKSHRFFKSDACFFMIQIWEYIMEAQSVS